MAARSSTCASPPRRSWKDRDGNRQERTEWHRVVIFNENLGRVAKQYLRKGSKVYLEGQIQTRKWTDQSGQDKYTTEIVLQRFRGELVLLDRRDGGGAAEDHGDSFGGSSDFGGAQRQPQARPVPAFDSDLDDDVPVLTARQAVHSGPAIQRASLLHFVPEPGERARTGRLPPRSSRPPP